jgi:RHS repeat-associated protein
MGREADAPGLYYYRARYYSPMMAGFISEDPIGFGGGQLSFYAAFRGDPLDFNDPYGLWSVSLQGYVGFGGGVVLTGTGFSLNSIGFRLGYGIGGGLDINPFGGKPDENAPSGSNSLGVFGEASAGVGPLAVGLGFNGGFTDKVDPDFTSHFCGYGGLEPELTSGKGHGWPFRFGGFELEGEASAGVELTHNF